MHTSDDELLCPDCGGRLHMVRGQGERQWFCPVAIGESGIDVDTREHCMDEGSKHRRVIAWKAEDGAIAKQREGARTYLRIDRKERREAA